jgi:hypothetical protein
LITGRNKSTPKTGCRPRRLYVDLSLCAWLVLVCPNGDFGRVRPYLQTDNIHAWVGRDAARNAGGPVSLLPLTDEEQLLRDLAYPLIEPPYDRQRWYSVLAEYGLSNYFNPDWYYCDPTAYAARLMTDFVRSETTRYSRLNEDVRNDIARLDQFFLLARRIIDLDQKREKALHHIPNLSGPEIANARARIGENTLVIGWVQRSLADRVASYRFALERLVVAVPSPTAVDVERSISYLHTRASGNILVAAPDFGAAPMEPYGKRALVSK